MTTKTLDDIMMFILNDPDVFSPPYDRNARSAIPLLFETKDWKRLKEIFEEGDKNSFNYFVDKQCQQLQQKNQGADKWRENKISETIKLGQSLKKAFNQKPYVLKQIFNLLESFGLIECKLPNMEDYGKIIENHDRPIVEQYFLYKIGKEKEGFRKRALEKTFEYLKELYAMNIDTLEIAFFIRKINSLTQFIEVIKDE